MTNIPSCCGNKSRYLVIYQIGSQYYVCGSCIKLPHFARGLVQVKDLSDQKTTIELVEQIIQQKIVSK